VEPGEQQIEDDKGITTASMWKRTKRAFMVRKEAMGFKKETEFFDWVARYLQKMSPLETLFATLSSPPDDSKTERTEDEKA
jgi:hypothetical protein